MAMPARKTGTRRVVQHDALTGLPAGEGVYGTGGDQFTLVVDCDHEGAMAVAERLRQVVTLPVLIGMNAMPGRVVIDVSVGIAEPWPLHDPIHALHPRPRDEPRRGGAPLR